MKCEFHVAVQISTWIELKIPAKSDKTHRMLFKGTLKNFILKKHVLDGDGRGKHAHVHIGLHITVGLLFYSHFPHTD